MTDSISAAAAPGSTAGAKTTLTGNYNDFLKLLVAQLKNQDPTSPLDTNQFTQQLVQYSQVEQQINTNANLTSLIQLQQGNEVLQSSALVGKTVVVQSDHVALQNGAAGLQFGPGAPASVAVGIYDASGVRVRDLTVDTTENHGAWTWDGRNNAGARLPDGSYRIGVTDASGGTAAVPFDVVATATGLAKSGADLQLQLGAMSVGFGAVQSVRSAP